MKVIISPLGGSVKPVIALYRKTAGDKIIVIPGKRTERVDPVEAANELKSIMKNLNIEVEIIPSVDAFYLEECLNSILEVLIRERGNERIVGTGPGTVPLSGAAIMAAWLEGGVKLFYIKEFPKPEEVIEIPCPGAGYYKNIAKRKIKILNCLEERKNTVTEIANYVNTPVSTTSELLYVLEEWGMVRKKEGESDRRKKVWEITPIGKFQVKMAREWTRYHRKGSRIIPYI